MLTAENREAKMLESVGITYAEMTPAQRRLFETVLDTYLGRVSPELAKRDWTPCGRRHGQDHVRLGGTLEVGGLTTIACRGDVSHRVRQRPEQQQPYPFGVA